MRALRRIRRIRRVAKITTGVYGHGLSVRRHQSVDAAGNPIPWYTYAAIEWLRQLDLSEMDVFEYGSGNSTIWWASQCHALTSVEHDRSWYDRTARLLPTTVDYRLLADPESYVSACDREYDIVIVDGVHRYDCARRGVERLRPGGVIIVDNSDWMWNTTAYLREQGFTQVDFIGPGPINDYTWATAVMLPGTRLKRRERMKVLGGIDQQGGADDSPRVIASENG